MPLDSGVMFFAWWMPGAEFPGYRLWKSTCERDRIRQKEKLTHNPMDTETSADLLKTLELGHSEYAQIKAKVPSLCISTLFVPAPWEGV